MKMPFGKYKGKEMDDLPATYLDWLMGQSWIGDWPLVVEYIESHRQSIRSELGVENELG